MSSIGNALFNGPPIVSGAAVGTTLSVADSTALAAFSTKGMQIGTRVFNINVGAYFELSLSTASLVPDSVVAVSGITGMRWIVKSAASGVESVTGPAVDNTDPLNPVVSNTATTAADGLLPSGLFSLQPALSSTVIGDANTTIHPFAEKRSVFFVAAGVLTANRNLIVDNATPIATSQLWIIVEPQTHTLFVQDITSGTIVTVAASTQAQVVSIYLQSTQWIANTRYYASN